jgi:hypothetical protein
MRPSSRWSDGPTPRWVKNRSLANVTLKDGTKIAKPTDLRKLPAARRCAGCIPDGAAVIDNGELRIADYVRSDGDQNPTLGSQTLV